MGNSIGRRRGTLFCMIFTLCLSMPLAALGQQNAGADFGALQKQLEDLGWRAERSPAGDLLLWPPGQQGGSPSAVVAKQADAGDDSIVTGTNIEALKAKLTDKGWDVREDGDGSLLLYPGETAATAVPDARDLASETAEESDDFLEIQALLAASGWRMERDTQGDLKLYPQLSVPSETPTKTVLQVASSDLRQVREALTASGWRLQETWDGSLMLYPGKAVAAPVTAANTTGQMAWYPQVAGGIELPVDSWREARKIADAWLENQPGTDLAVGKIRKINWVYLVSIVENKKPFRLNNQLVIRNRDGRVVLLF